ncbi:hypothetical protein CU086_00630 [Candidatus Nasuia deltocephalinicola]|uniref:Cytochrome c domain-containing protein n=1 Tax=Candidatus Nasuia deltocephalincola TaxID=1160784 RepID=A0A975A3C4_9PROT|nr:hypothetical protein CU086_00630 [Candidatus Nasuia deltocephalinicola]
MIEIIINIIIKIIKNKKLKIFYLKKNVNKGKYLITIGNCISCHTLEGGKPFGGGYSIKTKFGIVNSPNITSNKKYGIGELKLKNFIKLMKNGISKKGEFIIPIFPYKNFSKIKKKDLKEMFFFLKKTKNENILNKKNSLKFPIKYKKLIIFSRIIFLKKKKELKKK